MKNITMLFHKPEFEYAHLNKDTFSVLYYISKRYNLSADIVYLNTEKNQDLPLSYRGVNLTGIPDKGKLSSILYLIKNGRKIDCLMMFHFIFQTELLSVIYKILNPKGKVYVKLDLDPKKKYSVINRFIKIILLYFLNILSIRLTDLFSVETLEAYDMIKKKFYGTNIFNKLEYLPNGFDEGLLKKENVSVKPFDQKENLIITVGRIGTRQKNNQLLLKAIEKIDLRGWTVKMIGPYTNDFKAEFDQFISDNQDKKGKVILTGNVSDKKELYDYYNRAKCFMLTSGWEGFPLVFLEALRFGNYIITTDVGGAVDITENSKIGTVIRTGDVPALKEKIEQMINGKVDLNKKYKESIDLCMKKFIWENMINDSKKIEELVKNNC